jgi:uncharacterized membrane protein
LLGVIVWVGGMFFAYMALRPAAAQLLEAPQRLMLWRGVFARFFPWVWLSILFILSSGLIMIAEMGGFGVMPISILVMFVLGLLMMLIFAHVFFAAYGKLKRHVAAQAWPAAGAALAQIRSLVGVNLSLGLIIVGVITVGHAIH